MGYTGEKSFVMAAKGVEVEGSTDWLGPGPEVSHGIVLSGGMRVWSVGPFCFQGPGAETQLKSRC